MPSAAIGIAVLEGHRLKAALEDPNASALKKTLRGLTFGLTVGSAVASTAHFFSGGVSAPIALGTGLAAIPVGIAADVVK
jgi:hypothetical protein